MFDSHCHLNSKEFEKNLADVVGKARDRGVGTFLVPGVNLTSSRLAVEITESFSGVYASVGVHPTEKLDEENIEKDMVSLEDLKRESTRVLAIGEIGLDYYHFAKEFDSSTRDIQKKYFEEQLRLAVKLGLPVIIHNRHATEDVLEVMKETEVGNFHRKAVFHCCPPERKLLSFAKENQIYVGVDGDVTYDSAKQSFTKRIPLDLLLVETDSPYLTPEPARSIKKFPNTPSNLIYTVKKIAEIKRETKETISKITTENARRLFDL